MKLRIALFGQAAFARDVLDRLLAAGHEIVGVYTPPEGGRPDPLAEAAREHGLRLIQHRFFRRKDGSTIGSRVKEHAELGAELNVLAYVTAFLPPEITDAPAHRSLCFHPSLLPRFRGGAAIPWQIIEGEAETGVSVFQPDAGVDTGPVVVQRGGVEIGPEDTAASLYYEKLYPLGVDAVCEAVERTAAGRAELRVQDESQASFQGLVDDAVARVDWSWPGQRLDRLIRGCDPQPGAHLRQGGERIRLFGARFEPGDPGAEPGEVVALEQGAAWVAALGGRLRIARVRRDGGPKQTAAEAGLRAGDRLEEAPPGS